MICCRRSQYWALHIPLMQFEKLVTCQKWPATIPSPCSQELVAIPLSFGFNSPVVHTSSQINVPGQHPLPPLSKWISLKTKTIHMWIWPLDGWIYRIRWSLLNMHIKLCPNNCFWWVVFAEMWVGGEVLVYSFQEPWPASVMNENPLPLVKIRYHLWKSVTTCENPSLYV